MYWKRICIAHVRLLVRWHCPPLRAAGCATLAAALHSGALPALGELYLDRIPASAAAKAAVRGARYSVRVEG